MKSKQVNNHRVVFFDFSNQNKPRKYDEYDQSTQISLKHLENSFKESSAKKQSPEKLEKIFAHSQMFCASEIQQYQFNDKELSLLRKRFQKISKNGIMDQTQFRESLGIMGITHASFLSKRIFKLIDRNNHGKVNFEDFLSYLNIVINGTQLQKAQMSFQFLDYENKGFINNNDFERLMTDVVIFWNYLSGSRVIPDNSYVQNIVSCFETNKKGEIYFTEYYKKYEILKDIFDWYTFFNPQSKTKKNPDAYQNHSPEYRKSLRISKVDETVSQLQDSVFECLVQLKESKHRKSMQSSTLRCFSQQLGFSVPSYQQQATIEQTIDGPLCISLPVSSKAGDQDPNEEDYEYNKFLIVQKQQSANSNQNDQDVISLEDFTRQINNNYIDAIDEKISALLQIVTQDDLEVYNGNPINFSISQKSIKDSAIQKNSLSLTLQDPVFRRATLSNIPPKTEKSRKNLSIYFGHQNWNLILNMMIGMRTAVKSIQPHLFYQEFKESEFNTKYNHDVVTQRSNDFDYRKAYKFIDYSPTIFERIRQRYGITKEAYLRSVGPEDMLGNLIMGKLSSLTELSSSGKSGSFFYFTEDSKYMIKTISRNEKQFLRQILQNYYKHIMSNKHTMISRIFGLHAMRIHKSKTNVKKIYLIVIANIFTTPIEIDIRYDLKGSSYGRKTRKFFNEKIDKNIALKDQDILEDKNKIRINQKEKLLLVQQITSDSEFMEQNGIIDYSLLVGIHYLNTEQRQTQSQNLKEGYEFQDHDIFYERDLGGLISKDKSCIYYLGIIDILTQYNTRKKMEYQIKSTFVDSDISCVPPRQYTLRFKEFILSKVIE